MGRGAENWFGELLALLFVVFRTQGLFGEKSIERVWSVASDKRNRLDANLRNSDFLDSGWVRWLISGVVYFAGLSALVTLVFFLSSLAGFWLGISSEEATLNFFNVAVLLMLAVCVEYLRRLDARQSVLLEEVETLRNRLKEI